MFVGRKAMEIIMKKFSKTTNPKNKLSKLGGIEKRERMYATIALIPALIFFCVFTYWPLLKSMFYSFTDWNGYSSTYNFVKFDNFKAIGIDQRVIKAFLNTLYFSVLSTVLGTIIQLIFATLLNKAFKGCKVYKTLFYIPVVVSFMIMSLSWRYILQYDGILNSILRSIGLEGLVQNWLGDPKWSMNMIILINLLSSSGIGIVLFLAGMNGISLEIYEAAEMDGARGFTLFRKITWPLIMPAVTITLFIGITGSLKIFDLPYMLTNGGPLGSTETVMMLIYDMAFKNERFGRASAMGIVFFAIIAIVSICQLTYSRKREIEQ